MEFERLKNKLKSLVNEKKDLKTKIEDFKNKISLKNEEIIHLNEQKRIKKIIENKENLYDNESLNLDSMDLLNPLNYSFLYCSSATSLNSITQDPQYFISVFNHTNSCLNNETTSLLSIDHYIEENYKGKMPFGVVSLFKFILNIPYHIYLKIRDLYHYTNRLITRFLDF